jgi:hypothetical protein
MAARSSCRGGLSITPIAARHSMPLPISSARLARWTSVTSSSAKSHLKFTKNLCLAAPSTVGCRDMSTSPGPGRWLASDGQWYPQRWETIFIYETNESLKELIDEVSRLTKTHGEQGWEIVSSAVQRTQVAHHFKGYDKGGELFFEWSIVCSMKRPLRPE